MNSDQYAEEIKHTRAEIDQTLSSLENKLTPQELWEQVLDWSGGSREFYGNLSRIVRENPIPVTLMGISLVWLMATGNSGKSNGDIAEDPDSHSSMKEKYDSLKSTVSGTAAMAGGRVKELSEDLKHKGEQLADQGQEIKEKIGQRTSGLGGRIVLLSAVGMALGAVVALTMPASRREEEFYAETGDDLRDKAREVSRQQLEKGRQAAAAVTESLKEKITDKQQHGIGSRQEPVWQSAGTQHGSASRPEQEQAPNPPVVSPKTAVANRPNSNPV